MCAPISGGAIDPVGMTNASTTNARKTNARIKATRIDSIVSLMFPSGWGGGAGVDSFESFDSFVSFDSGEDLEGPALPAAAPLAVTASVEASVVSARSDGM